MIPRTVRLYNPHGEDRVALVSAEPSTGRPGEYLIRLARGARSGQLTSGSVYGPIPADQLESNFAAVIDSLQAEGFQSAGLHELLSELQRPEPVARARAAARLGWRRDREAVDALLALLPAAVEETCALVDALGAIGDPRAVPVLREYARRKLLSRRRSAVEALRNLGDATGLAEARQRALEQLPPGVRQALATIDDNHPTAESVSPVTAAVQALEMSKQGLAMDTLYELATPVPVAAVHAYLQDARIDQVHVWRYIKSVYKRAMLRHDYATFGWLSHAVEARARTSPGTTATIKSGYDGQQRQTRIFGRKTQQYLRRLAWRYLRKLATHRPEAYPHAAAEVVIHYAPEDTLDPHKLIGAFAECYLLHRILWGGSKRFTLDNRRLVFRYRSGKDAKVPGNVREEAYPQLWDAQPRAYLRLLGAARLPEAHEFALKAVAQRHRAVLEAAPTTEVLPLLNAPHEPTVQLGLAELNRRFDPQRPDWELLGRLLADERPMARGLGLRWLRLTAPLWACDPQRTVAFLLTADGETRSVAAELACVHVPPDPTLRQDLASRILAILRQPETAPGTHDGLARLARELLLDELGALVTVGDLVALVLHGSPAAQSVAGELLGRRPDAVSELGLQPLLTLAQHQVVAVRRGTHALLRSAAALFQADPSALFILVESEWADTRALAFDLIRETDLAALGLDGLLGVLDSNRIDVQDFGKELVTRHFERLAPAELVNRLAEHPHPNMRRFALQLVVEYLPPGAVPLARLDRFFRAALFDLWPQRKEKRQVLDFLARRGLQDEEQAQVVAGILGDAVRMKGRADFERALEALVRIKLAFPQVEAPVALQPGGVA